MAIKAQQNTLRPRSTNSLIHRLIHSQSRHNYSGKTRQPWAVTRRPTFEDIPIARRQTDGVERELCGGGSPSAAQYRSSPPKPTEAAWGLITEPRMRTPGWTCSRQVHRLNRIDTPGHYDRPPASC